MRRTAVLTLLALPAALLTAAGAWPAADAAPSPTTLRDVMWVGNNWAGTASIVDARRLTVLKRGVNLIPDKAQELAEIQSDPEKLAFYLAIQQGPGEGHDQYVDDMFGTRSGRYLAVSRPSFADVVWVDVAKAIAGRSDSIVREQPMDGHRADHMGVSPDGRRLLVSDSTERQVIEFSMVDETVGGRTIAMGDRLRTFESGETPHESNYTKDGARIFHASIGKVYTPGDATGVGPVKIGPVHDALKGDRWFQIVRNGDFQVTQRWDMGKELAEAGYPDMSSAVRPMALAPDERFVYFQVSYFHGLIEFDTQARDTDGVVGYTAGGIPEPRTGAVRRVVNLPNRVPTMPLEQYVNDSAHHGLAMDQKGTTLCAAGTMDAGGPQDDGLPDLRHSDHRPLLRQAVLDHRGDRRHLLGLAERGRLGGRAQLRAEEGARLPRGRRPPAADPARSGLRGGPGPALGRRPAHQRHQAHTDST
jgi:hypothetical protein